MGKHERVKDKAKPVSSDEATPQPKMALADNGPRLDLSTEKGESELPKLEAPKLDAGAHLTKARSATRNRHGENRGRDRGAGSHRDAEDRACEHRGTAHRARHGGG
jgi:hypothetical protein